MRKELLEGLKASCLPIYVGPPNLSAEQLQCLADMIDEGWIEGHPLTHSSGTGFIRIHIVRIMDSGLQAIADDKPIARAKKGISRTAKVIIAILTFVTLVLGIAISWRQLQEPQPSFPSPTPGFGDSAQQVQSEPVPPAP